MQAAQGRQKETLIVRFGSPGREERRGYVSVSWQASGGFSAAAGAPFSLAAKFFLHYNKINKYVWCPVLQGDGGT